MTHCWMGRTEWIEQTYGYLSDEYIADAAAAYDGKMSATCMLPDGHDGPHEFTDDDQIRISFAPHTEADRLQKAREGRQQ